VDQFVGQRIGNYRIIRQIGEGGMGVVYEGLRDDIGSRAAIKVLRAEFAMKTEIAARFFNEARAANLIEHPGIVKIFDYGQLPSGAAFLAMEYLAGESLHQRLTREKRLSETDTIRIGRQVAMALTAAHAKKVIHRDLKPENIILVPDIEAPSGERAKILDFGIAKLAREHSTAITTDTSVVMGTPVYMSPEQCKGGKSVGDRADVYALGVMLFEMLSGRTPFVAEEPGEYIGMHLFKEPPPIGSLVENLLPKLRMLVDSMLLKDAQKRPAMSAVAMILRDLSNISTDVKSIAELLRESNPDGESPPAQNPLGLAKTDAALPVAVKANAALPVSSLARPLPAIPVPAALKRPAAALAPLGKTIDPLSDTLPGRDQPAELPSSLEQTLTEPQPAEQPIDPLAPTAAKLQPIKPAAAVDPRKRPSSAEPPTVKGRKARPAGSPQAPPAADEVTVAEGAPADPTAPLKPRVVPAGSAIDAITQRPGNSTPAWQQVQIVTGSPSALESLDTQPPAPEPGDTDRGKRRRPLGKQLRRLRFRIKKRVYGWFGVDITEQRNTPTRTTSPGQNAPIYAVLAVVVAVAAILVWRRSTGPQPVSEPPAQTVAATPGQRSTTPATPPTEDPTAQPTPAAPPMPEAISQIPDEVKAVLTEAKEKEDDGNPQAAYKLLRSASKKINHSALWSALGRYACQLENAKAANEALSRLSPETPFNARDRQKLIRKCESLGLLRNDSGLFEPRN
jgi:serine/threonine-protein kinase